MVRLIEIWIDIPTDDIKNILDRTIGTRYVTQEYYGSQGEGPIAAEEYIQNGEF